MFFNQASLLGYARAELPAKVLAFRAQQVLNELDYRDKADGTARRIQPKRLELYRLPGPSQNSKRARLLATHRPAVITFWYRQSPTGFRVDSFPTPSSSYLGDVIDYEGPANLEPGMVRLRLDAKGRLIGFEAGPSQNIVRALRLTTAYPRIGLHSSGWRNSSARGSYRLNQ